MLIELTKLGKNVQVVFYNPDNDNTQIFQEDSANVECNYNNLSNRLTVSIKGGPTATTTNIIDNDILYINSGSGDILIKSYADYLVNYALLFLNGGTPSAPSINVINTAFVSTDGNDTTAILGNPAKPYATIQSALDNNTAVEYLTIKIGLGEFDNPDFNSFRDNLTIQGSGKPGYDNQLTFTDYNNYTSTIPTKLVGGTILHKIMLIVNKKNITLLDFGVDVGKYWVDNFNGGVPEYSGPLLIAQNFDGGPDGYHPTQEDYPPNTDCVIKNIATLGTPESVHGFLIESKFYPIVDNITSCVSLYNMIIKCVGGNFSNINLFSSGAAGLYIKSNYYAYFKGLNITNLNINSLTNTETGNGILIGGENLTDYLTNLNISNFNITRVADGIKFYNGSGSTICETCMFSNGLILNNRGKGITTGSVDVYYSNFTNIILKDNAGNDVEITTGDYNNLDNLRSINCGGNAFNLSATTRIDANNILAINQAGTDYTYNNTFTVNKFRNLPYNFNNIPVYVDNAAALLGGLVIGDIYRHDNPLEAGDQLRIVH